MPPLLQATFPEIRTARAKFTDSRPSEFSLNGAAQRRVDPEKLVLPSPVTLLGWGQVPPLLATVPRNPDGPRQIH